MKWYLVMLGQTVLHRSTSKKFAELWAKDFNEGLPDVGVRAIVVRSDS